MKSALKNLSVFQPIQHDLKVQEGDATMILLDIKSLDKIKSEKNTYYLQLINYPLFPFWSMGYLNHFGFLM